MTRKHRKFAVVIEGDFPEKVTEAEIESIIKFALVRLSIPGPFPAVSAEEKEDGKQERKRPS